MPTKSTLQYQRWWFEWLLRIVLVYLVTGVVPVLGVLTVPLEPREPGAPLRVLIIGRISTPHQRQESIEASYEYAEKFLRQAHAGPIVFTRLGEQESGMVADRPTIRQAEDLIESGQVDLILVEDVGRIYRDPRHLLAFVNDAVDAGVRLIAINDGLDTADEDWEVTLTIAMVRHGFASADARKRVGRTATYAFHKGGDVKKVPFGYRKLNKEEAASGNFGTVGLRMAKLDECTPIIKRMTEMVLEGRTYEEIADWVNGEKIKPGKFSKKGHWTAKLVISFLRNPLLHGERELRKVIFQRIRKTGKHRRIANPNPEHKLYPELAHLSAEKHSILLSKMDEKAAALRRSKGSDHPRYRVPRSEGIWPCARDATCSVCGAPAYVSDDDKLKCSNSFLTGCSQCWNHVVAGRNAIREAVIPWVVGVLQQDTTAWTAFQNAAWDVAQRVRNKEGGELVAAKKDVDLYNQEALRLGEAIAKSNRKLDTLLTMLEQCEEALRNAKARYETIKGKGQGVQPVDREAFLADPLPAILELSNTSFDFGALFRTIVTELLIIPVQDRMHGQVHPRVKVTIEFPASDGADSSGISRTEFFDVFVAPQHIARLEEVRKFREQDPNASYREIGSALGIGYMTVKRTIQYMRLMEGVSSAEPFIVLIEKPARASRWKDRGSTDLPTETPDDESTNRS